MKLRISKLLYIVCLSSMIASCTSIERSLSGQYTATNISPDYMQLSLNSDATFHLELKRTGVGYNTFIGHWKQKKHWLKLVENRYKPYKAALFIERDANADKLNKITFYFEPDSSRLAGVNFFYNGKTYESDTNGEIILDSPLNGKFRVNFLDFDQTHNHHSTDFSSINIYLRLKEPTPILRSIPIKKLSIKEDHLVTKKHDIIFQLLK